MVRALLGILGLLAVSLPAAAGIRLEAIRVPPGFSITLFADGVNGARSLAVADDVVFVGTRLGEVYAIPDRDRDGRGDAVLRIASGLDEPNGVAVHEDDLFVAEPKRVLRYRDLLSHLDDPPASVVLEPRFPEQPHHRWRYIGFDPQGRLYVPIGAPCNICESGPEFSTITRFDPHGGEREVFARGVRNTVGFDWHPETGELWFTDNGRDWFGNHEPPDELNRAPRAGLHFGFPHCHGADLEEPKFPRGECEDFEPPAFALPAHVAALGMRFYTGTQFPEEYRGRIFVAEHGSWNATDPVGYRVTTLRVTEDSADDYRVFAEGWLDEGGSYWGTPVDVEVAADGALLVSDDEAGAVYRISYESD